MPGVPTTTVAVGAAGQTAVVSEWINDNFWKVETMKLKKF